MLTQERFSVMFAANGTYIFYLVSIVHYVHTKISSFTPASCIRIFLNGFRFLSQEKLKKSLETKWPPRDKGILSS